MQGDKDPYSWMEAVPREISMQYGRNTSCINLSRGQKKRNWHHKITTLQVWKRLLGTSLFS